MAKFYLKATGSACYDFSGITFPQTKSFDLEMLIMGTGGTSLIWERQFGWRNQPLVLTFEATGNQSALIALKINSACLPLMVSKKWWRKTVR